MKMYSVSSNRHLVDTKPTLSQQLGGSRVAVGWQSGDCRVTQLVKLSADCRPLVAQLTYNELYPMHMCVML